MWSGWRKQLPFAEAFRVGDHARSRERSATTILIADESALARSLLRFKLKRVGYRVLAAKDGARALRLARNLHPHLVVTGLMFPDTTGVELLRALRDIDPNLPVVVLTMRLEESEMVEALRLGAVDYLTKPYRPGELLARIERILQQRGLAT